MNVIACRFQSAGSYVALGAAVVGLFGIADWTLAVGPRLVPPATALALLFAGISLWLVAARPRRRCLARFLALLAPLLASGAGALPSTALPSPLAMLEIVLLATGVAAIGVPSLRGLCPAKVLAGIGGVIALWIAAAYLFSVPLPLASAGQDLSPAAAAAFLALASGIMCARPQEGLLSWATRQDASGLVARWLLIGATVLVLTMAAAAAGERIGLYGRGTVVLAIAVSGMLILLALSGIVSHALASTEAGQRQSVDSLGQLVGQVSDAVFLVGDDDRIIDANDAAGRLLGTSRDELLGQSFPALLAVEHDSFLTARAALTAGQTYSATWRFKRHDDLSVPRRILATPEPPGRWRLLVQDIPEAREEATIATKAAATLEEALAILPHGGLDAVLKVIVLQAQSVGDAEMAAIGVGTDPERPFDPWVSVGVAPGLTETLGRPPRPMGTLGRVARGEVVRTSEVIRHPAFHGLPPQHPAITSFLGVPIRHEGGQFGNLYLANKRTAREFSERDQHAVEMLAARAALIIEATRTYESQAAERAWLQSVIDQMPEGVAVWDARGHRLAINRAALAMSVDPGTTDPFGDPILFDVRRPDNEPLPVADWPIARAIKYRETTTGRELLLRQRDGRLTPISVSAGPVEEPSGKLIGAVAVIHDVSGAKEVERLRHEWTSVIAHDLRQPIAVIGLTAEMIGRLHEGVATEAETRAVARIRASASTLKRLIEDLTDASCIEARRLLLKPQPLGLLDLVSDVVDRISPLTLGRTIRVDAAARPVVSADPQRIEQVLTNLITNALKHGTPGTDIIISVRNPPREAEVVVENEGPIIPAEDITHLFERFERATEARAKGLAGLGLGLYICRGLVEAHGGRIWVESASGRTAFHFTLPM